MKTAQNRCKAILSTFGEEGALIIVEPIYLSFASSTASITAQRLGKAAYDYHMYSTNHHCYYPAELHAVAASMSQISREVPIHRHKIDRPICVLGHPSMIRSQRCRHVFRSQQFSSKTRQWHLTNSSYHRGTRGTSSRTIRSSNTPSRCRCSSPPGTTFSSTAAALPFPTSSPSSSRSRPSLGPHKNRPTAQPP